MTYPTLLSDRFVLGERLGAGGMGEVFAAYDLRDARTVAVKRLHATAARDPELVRRFAREGAILRSAAHPNIVDVLAVIESPIPHIVMEYVPGGSLQERLARQPQLPITDALTLGLDLSDALARAHRLGVVHRDVKPANVLLAADGTPRLTDFGIASIGGTEPLTGPGVVLGTLPYLAPEGWDGEEPDARADIWSLGVVLYEALAGRRPFVAEHAGLLFAAIALQDPPRLGALRPEVPPSLAEAIHRMLAKRPEDRMASIRELGLRVERLLQPAVASTERTRVPVRTPGADLPRPATALIGRESERTEVVAMLQDGAVRILTLTGSGGSGKTRLAIAAAADACHHFPDGALFVDLTSITDPTLVLPALARALEVEEELHRPLHDILAERLGGTRRVVVLDNFEQVLAAGPDVARLAAAVPRVTFLVTSRFRLGLAAEREYLVPPLSVGDARELFASCARALDPGFRLDPGSAAAVAEICRRLDRLPLAIELAAARSRVLAPAALLARLDNPLTLLTSGGVERAPHRRTLRDTIEWSVRLLDERDRSLFIRLAVFVGGWLLDDALAVVGEPDGSADVPALVDGLQSLVEKSLVTVVASEDEPRYRLLETLREYAWEQLQASPDAGAVARRHARHFAERAEAWDEEITTAAQAEALGRFGAAHGNLRAALGWYAANDTGSLPAVAGALGRFWYLGGYWHEALEWYERALAGAPDAPAEVRARVLDLRGRLEMFLGDEPPALRHHEDAWGLVASTGSARLRARVAEGLGEVLLKVGDVPRATALLETATAIARETGHSGTLAEALATLATARVGAGAYEAAEVLLIEALALGRRQGDRFALARIHYYLGGLALLADDPARCRAYCEEGRRVAGASGDEAWACHLDEMLGRALAAEARWDEAQAMVDRSVHAFHQVGSRSCLPHSFEAGARLRAARAAAGAGDISGDLASAARLLGAADALCRELAIAMLPVERALLAQTAERVRRALGDAAYQERWEAGRLVPESAAIAEVASSAADGGGGGATV